MADKTAATCADTVMETFDRTRRLLQEWVEKYVAAYIKHQLKALPADAETDEAAVAAEAKAHELNIFGDPTKVAFARVEAGGGDHCNGPKLGVRLCGEKGKSAEKMKEYYGDEWDALTEHEQKWKSVMIEFGCQHHYRCIGWGGGDKTVRTRLVELLKEDIDKVKAANIVFVDGTQDESIRSILLFFGNTTGKKH